MLVDDGGQVHKASFHRQIRDIYRPNLVDSVNSQFSEQVLIDHVSKIAPTGVGFAVDRFDAHLLHQASHPCTANCRTLASQQITQHPCTRKRIVQMQPVHRLHQCQVRIRDWHRLVVNRRSGNAQCLSLSGGRKFVGRVNHFLALSLSALKSALSKKSLASESSPTFACSRCTSILGLSGFLPSKTASAPLTRSAFHCAIWVACTSYFSASSASGNSPRTASNATFALKAAEWFRRGRLVVLRSCWQYFLP